MSDQSTNSLIFTENDIILELNSMGVYLNADQLKNLKTELDALLAEENFEDHTTDSNRSTGKTTPNAAASQPVSSFSQNSSVSGPVDPIKVLATSRKMHERIQNEFCASMDIIDEDSSDPLDPYALLQRAQVMHDAVICDAERIDALISVLSYHENKKDSDREEELEKKSQNVSILEIEHEACECQSDQCSHKQAMINLRQALRERGLSDQEIDNKVINRQAVNIYQQAFNKPDDPLLMPTLRELINVPAYGELPFKHDPVARYHLYKKEWDRLPPPGAQQRYELRTKIRALLMRNDAIM